MRVGAADLASTGPGLIDGDTLETLARADEIPHGVEVNSDGAWCLGTASRLIRPAVLAVIAAASAVAFGSVLVEMVRQLIAAAAS